MGLPPRWSALAPPIEFVLVVLAISMHSCVASNPSRDVPSTHAWVSFDVPEFDGARFPLPEYAFAWRLDSSKVEFHVECLTFSETSWVGHGISPTGGMKGSDLAVLVPSPGGVWTLEDRFATDFALPQLDEVQNVDLISASYNSTSGVTSFSYKRDVQPCDGAQDVPVNQHGYTRMMFAYGSMGPNDDIAYHGPSQRGTAYVDLFSDESEDPSLNLPTDAQSVTVLSPPYTPDPSRITTYACSVQENVLPNDTKYHAVAFEPIVNSPLVHHMILYDCLAQDIPPGIGSDDVVTCGDLSMCTVIWWAWAVGAPASYYPQDQGVPFGLTQENTPQGIVNVSLARKLVLEIHYDNPGGLNVTDSGSGFNITYTPTLREKDIGLLVLGLLPVDFAPSIPPGEELYEITADCPTACLSDRLDSEITITGGFVHMHLSGAQATVHHIVDGEEVDPLLRVQYYDFNYQASDNVFGGPRTFRPNDALRVTCRYRTVGFNETTQMGSSTSDEMCLAFLNYFPRSPRLSFCLDITENPYGLPTAYGCSDGRVDLTNIDVENDLVSVLADHVILVSPEDVQFDSVTPVISTCSQREGNDGDGDSINAGRVALVVVLSFVFAFFVTVAALCCFIAAAMMLFSSLLGAGFYVLQPMETSGNGDGGEEMDFQSYPTTYYDDSEE